MSLIDGQEEIESWLSFLFLSLSLPLSLSGGEREGKSGEKRKVKSSFHEEEARKLEGEEKGGNSHLSKVAVVGFAGLDVLVGSGLGGSGHGGEGRAGDQEGRDGGGTVFFCLVSRFFLKEREESELVKSRYLFQTAPALAREEQFRKTFSTLSLSLSLSPQAELSSSSRARRLSLALELTMNESWPSKSRGLGSLSLSLEKSTLFFSSLAGFARASSLSCSLSASSLAFFSLVQPIRSCRSFATAVPSNSSLRPALKLTEVMNDGFS